MKSAAGANYVRAYQTLFSGTDKLYRDEGNPSHAMTTRAVTDCTPTYQQEDTVLNLVRHGNLRLDIHFANALDKTINVIIYAEFNNILETDQARNIIFDYTS